jgi:putative membrane protein
VSAFYLHIKRGLNREKYAHVTTAWGISLIAWLTILIATPISIWVAGEEIFPLMATLGVLAQAGSILLALAGNWRRSRFLGVIALVLVVAWGVEALGSATGFPFGAYSYTDALKPQLAGVPLLVPLAWLMMLAPAWAIAETILALRGQHRLGRWYAPLHAILTGAAFTAWDLYLDPQMVAHKLWLWDNPGGYFGIPWVNFLGWWLTSTLLTLLIRPSQLPHLRLMAIYVLTWIFQAIGLGIFWGMPGPALAGFLVMGAFFAWAGYREAKAWTS